MLHATHTKSRSLSILQSIFLCFFVGSLKACISKPYIKYRKRTCLQYEDRLRSCLARDSSLEGLLKGIPYSPGGLGTAPPVSSTLLFLCALASLFVVSSILEAAGRINLCHKSWWAGVLGEMLPPLLSCAIITGAYFFPIGGNKKHAPRWQSCAASKAECYMTMHDVNRVLALVTTAEDHRCWRAKDSTLFDEGKAAWAWLLPG